jgi:hypothetical protein
MIGNEYHTSKYLFFPIKLVIVIISDFFIISLIYLLLIQLSLKLLIWRARASEGGAQISTTTITGPIHSLATTSRHSIGVAYYKGVVVTTMAK